MRSMWKRPGAACAALALMAALAAADPASGQGWSGGTIKGQVVFEGKVLPPNPPVNVNNDVKHCLSKGKILRNEIVVNSKNKGVRWVLVWLAPVKDFANPNNIPPIHPSLQKVPAKLEIDQPCCVFEPRVVAIREGTDLVFKNSAPVAHNVDAKGGALGPNFNVLIPPGKKHEVNNVKARLIPFSYGCSIHAWMKGWVGVFKHPYFTVTDADGKFEIKKAPPGKWRVILWHEKVGFVIQKSKEDRGKIVEVKNGGTTDLKKIMLSEVDD